MIEKETFNYCDIYLGEALNILEYLIKNKIKIDAILTDPPYGTTACKWDNIIPFEDMWDKLFKLSQKETPIILFGREPFSSKLICSNIKNYKHKWIWNKKQSGSFQNAKFMPLQIEEDIIVFGKGKINYYPEMRKGKMRKRGGAKEASRVVSKGLNHGYENYSDLYYPTNIIEISNPRRNKLHPTQKPVELLEYLIKTYTKPGDTVLDFTAGSFSTAIACINTDRKFIGIELDETYYQIGKKRIIEHLSNIQ